MSTNLNPSGTPTGPYQLYKINPSNKQVFHLNPSANNDGWHTWMPDDKHIVFSSIPAGPGSYIMDPDGANAQQLTHGVLGRFNYNQFPSVSPQAADPVCLWGPGRGASDLPDEDRWEPSIQLTQSSTFYDVPSWSPDGTKIIYAEALDNNGNQNIYTMNKDGTSQQAVTYGTGEQTAPSWDRIRRTTS